MAAVDDGDATPIIDPSGSEQAVEADELCSSSEGLGGGAHGVRWRGLR